MQSEALTTTQKLEVLVELASRLASSTERDNTLQCSAMIDLSALTRFNPTHTAVFLSQQEYAHTLAHRLAQKNTENSHPCADVDVLLDLGELWESHTEL